jgi:hypothetical protein
MAEDKQESQKHRTSASHDLSPGSGSGTESIPAIAIGARRPQPPPPKAENDFPALLRVYIIRTRVCISSIPIVDESQTKPKA